MCHLGYDGFHQIIYIQRHSGRKSLYSTRIWPELWSNQMARKHIDAQEPKPPRKSPLNRDSIQPMSPSETALYIAQMCVELRMLSRASAQYIAFMTSELATLASSTQLDHLSALLETVRSEAESEARRVVPSL